MTSERKSKKDCHKLIKIIAMCVWLFTALLLTTSGMASPLKPLPLTSTIQPHLLILPVKATSPLKTKTQLPAKPLLEKNVSAPVLKDITAQKTLSPKTVVIPKNPIKQVVSSTKINKAKTDKTKHKMAAAVVKTKENKNLLPDKADKAKIKQTKKETPPSHKNKQTAKIKWSKEKKLQEIATEPKEEKNTVVASALTQTPTAPSEETGNFDAKNEQKIEAVDANEKTNVQVTKSEIVAQNTEETKLAQSTPAKTLETPPVPVTFIPAEEKREVQLVVGESKVISAFSLIRTAIGNPSVADIVVISNREILINGKNAGTTTLTLWDKRGRMTYVITVYKEPLTTRTKIFPLQYLWLRKYDVKGDSGTVTWTVTTNNTLISEIDKTLSMVLGQGSYSINSELNHIVVQGTEKDLHKAEEVIRKLDVPEQQILVEVRVLEVSEDDLKQTGITWNLNKEKVAVQYDSSGGQFKIDTLGQLSEQYIAQINALQDAGKTNLLANPKITTVLHTDPGIVFLGDSYPITTVTKDATGSSLQSVTYVDVGVNLFFLPTKVSEDGYVTMFVRIGSQTIIGFSTAGFPSFRGKNIRSEVRIKDGEAVVMGGLLRSDEIESMQKVPYLAELPFLGNFFKNKKKTTRKTEMIVIFTPHILKNPETIPASMTLPSEQK